MSNEKYLEQKRAYYYAHKEHLLKTKDKFYKSNVYSVYKHTLPDGRVYIGCTQAVPEYRWRNGQGYKTQTVFYTEILKYGWDNIKHEIIAVVNDKTEAKILEDKLILENRAMCLNIKNLKCDRRKIYRSEE